MTEEEFKTGIPEAAPITQDDVVPESVVETESVTEAVAETVAETVAESPTKEKVDESPAA